MGSERYNACPGNSFYYYDFFCTVFESTFVFLKIQSSFGISFAVKVLIGVQKNRLQRCCLPIDAPGFSFNFSRFVVLRYHYVDSNIYNSFWKNVMCVSDSKSAVPGVKGCG